MKIRLYNFSKKRNSTKQISNEQYVEFDGVVLKNATSMKDPVLILEGQLSTHNYLYVVDWGRYYFVTDRVSLHENLYEIHCKIDSLASFKTPILSYEAFIERSASHYSREFNDNSITPEQACDYTSDASTQILSKDSGSEVANQFCYVRMLGSGATGIKVWFDYNLNGWGSIFNPIFDNPQSLTISDYLLAYISDPSKYVISVQRGPIPISLGVAPADLPYLAIHGPDTAEADVTCGWFATGLRKNYIIKQHITHDFVLAKPTSMYGSDDFRSYSPAFTSVFLFMPGVGEVSISPDLLRSEIKLRYVVDVYCGDVMVLLFANSKLVSTYRGNLYSQIQIGDGGNGGVGSLINTAYNVAGDVISGNPIKGTGDIIEGFKNVISPQPSLLGTSTGVQNGLFPDAVLTIRQRQSGDAPINVYGAPCNKRHTLSTLSGYCKCQLASVSIDCESDILDEINTLLNSGFYIE